MNPVARAAVLATSTLALWTANASPAEAQEPPFGWESTARAYLDSLGFEGTYDELLDSEHWLQMDVGSFDLRLPVRELDDEEALEDVREVVGIMLRMQAAWGEWVLESKDERKELAKHVRTLEKWVERWKPSTFDDALENPDGDLHERLDTDDKVREAAARLAELLTPTAPAADGAPTPRSAQVVLTPSRRLYVEVLCTIGLLDPAQRQRVWQDVNLFTPNAWSARGQVIPLRHPAHPFDRRTAFTGWPVERYLTSSLEQHAADRLAASLLKNEFHWTTDALLETALSTNLLVASIGELRLVNDFSTFQWSRAGGSTQPYSRFVPGGNSAGGILPPRKAQAGPVETKTEENIHVKELGHSFFLAKLREKQKAGSKLARRDDELPKDLRKEKAPHFALVAGDEEHRVTAPFLGEGAKGKPIPPLSFLDDYEDFFTAYRSSFFEWLRTDGAGKESAARFPAFLEGMALIAEDETLGSVAARVYGVPLSYDPEGESLEGAFLDWLTKQR